MISNNPGFDIDLKTSPKVIVNFLVILGLVLFILSNTPVGLNQKFSTLLFSFLVWLSAWVAGRVIQKNILWGSWFVLAIVVLILFASSYWLGLNIILMFTFLPVALAGMMIDLRAAGVVAVAQTVLSGILWLQIQGNDFEYLIGSLVAIWLMVAILAAVYKPVLNLSQWAWNLYTSANLTLEEVRSQRVEVEQTLNDLADANLQLTRLNKLAQNLRHIAENARSTKEQFVANVSHELRTPLNMIIGYTEIILQNPMLYKKKIPGGLLADLVVIERNAKHLSYLINDILDLSQIETENMALTKEFVHFQEIIEFTISAVQPLYKLKGLYLESDVQPDLPEIFCDPVRIREVLLNLASNAGRFTEKGGIRIRAWQEKGNLLVSVTDTGPGIAKEDLARLFIPFEQLDSSIHKQYGGTGLGLAISKHFIEMHDGRIWVESNKGVGTTFTFQIPIEVENQSESADVTRWFNQYLPYEQRLRTAKLPQVKDRPSYLVIDRGDSFQSILKRYMGDVDITRAENIEEANHIMDHSSALAMLMNIPAVRCALSELGDLSAMNPDTPIIACSIPELGELSSQLNVADILVKPIYGSQLIESLERLNILSGTILIADDDPDVLQLFSRIFSASDHSYRIRQARDGQEVLNVLKECRPEAIFLDLAMPNISGYQLLSERNQRPEFADIPIIVTSARDADGHPIMSDMFLVTQKGGFSIRQLLTCIQVITQTLSPNAQSGGPALPANPTD